mmetsp:Transcript_90650/g.255962  ORF Transcript_90650/g.255962 Transcript_90650/m.255962 type:complete len:267 (-) Transcript_90650:182-982(-)|eukprot:CAMPEP_0117539854 /NCGR_PEP_ID=MMETSP0784-20121206/43199_1 /TAXON_ID=39447 /ORGANISM="" /LENGTH=266 /DNA_ID=CAMNT_0005336493 /DNA_START=37 /DNA_END=837 /DNA_ORIENTATION=+
MQNLSEGENMLLGGSAAFVEAIILQPTIYWKNAAQQGLPFTLDPKVVYRGLGAALSNEMGQMALQFGTTGCIKRLVAGEQNAELSRGKEFLSALLGGAVAAPYAQLAEVTMIQQQRHGGTLFGTALRIFRERGIPGGLFRGLISLTGRDAIYVGGLLGITPILQDTLVERYRMNQSLAGLTASCAGGLFAGVITTPMDAISTCMKGDLERKQYGGFIDTLQQRAAGGVKHLFGGVFWRSVNIIGTIAIANECRVRFAPLMFPGKCS